MVLHLSLSGLPPQETGVEVNVVEKLDILVRDVQQGHWDTVLKAIKNLRLADAALVDLYAQVTLVEERKGERERERKRDEKRTDRQTDKLRQRQTYRHTDTGTQTNRHTYTESGVRHLC